ncbi:MarR family transcriptional regulator [Bradyrhizobium sp. ISRA443]|uniref:MarR family winged helix-turn-helix transcriptional regulator n=1 Tax=unclassified Bradyrhizobium TaxID=2631580 RepID=UPI00247A644E|nr:MULTISPECIES: MarR family transcriptional regulator [unclassified Bradyrhizobium]WGR98461.1 MarR family transcriptional regulator [Bradyrhizobium sp. ISRA436]WGS05350.1 MarR family transcriptional regulator [Bradyrhizobium sp. ISRA437]WGS12236.1 MarR family transcriptional regulator [Bradyrhizobium sp. ISRA443]
MASVRHSRKAVGDPAAISAEAPGVDLSGKPERVADHLNNRIFFRLFQVANTLQKQAVKELGVTTVQWAVLGALSDPRPTYGMSVGTLADFLVVSRQNLDGVLKRLERDGLLERVTDPGDKRTRLVKLTREGFVFWAELRERIFQFYDQAVSGFKFDDRVALAHYLNELQRSLTIVRLEQPRRERKRAKRRS